MAGDERLGSKKAASDAVDAVLDTITGALAAGEEVSFTGFGDVEFAEASEADLLAGGKSAGDRVEHGVDSVASGFFAAQPLVACQLVQKLSLGHVENPPQGLKSRRNLTAATA